MSPTSKLLASVLQSTLTEVREKAIPVYTFALYHDHESSAVSVCVDTEENSKKFVVSSNRYNMKYFMEAIAEKNLERAKLWQANIGRSLSLGDFVLVNSARTDLKGKKKGLPFYFSMVNSLISVQNEIISLSPNPEHLIFASSGPNDEVEYVWSAYNTA